MTGFGKLLVFANLFVSVALFAWAFSLYANRIDYHDREVGEGDSKIKIDGQLTLLGNEVKRLSDAIKGSQGVYARSADLLRFQEQTRDYRHSILTTWLNEVKKENDPNATFRIIPRQPSGLADVAAPNPLPPFLSLNNKPLSGLGALNRQLDKLVKDETESINKIKISREKTFDFENQILVERKSGLQLEVTKLKVIRDNLKDEKAFVADAQINWEEQLRTLDLRKNQLQIRIDELKSRVGAGK